MRACAQHSEATNTRAASSSSCAYSAPLQQGGVSPHTLTFRIPPTTSTHTPSLASSGRSLERQSRRCCRTLKDCSVTGALSACLTRDCCRFCSCGTPFIRGRKTRVHRTLLWRLFAGRLPWMLSQDRVCASDRMPARARTRLPGSLLLLLLYVLPQLPRSRPPCSSAHVVVCSFVLFLCSR